MVVLEVIAVTLEDAVAAEAGGAQRIELIADYAEGGVTPSYGVIRMVRRAVRIPVYVMVRPRGGGFSYAPEEVEAMVEDARIARELGADGIVTGALTPDGAVDIAAMRRVLEAARLPATFHRAIDVAPDMVGALRQAASLPYVERVLTSGGAPSAPDGAANIARLVALNSAVEVMAGAGLTAANVAPLVAATGVQAVHFGAGARENGRVCAKKVEQIRRTLHGGQN